jgi:hypothetical protein
MATREKLRVKNAHSQSGGALVMLVIAAGVVALLIVVANITIFSRELNNNSIPRKQAYVEQVASALDNWYRINAAMIDQPGTSLVVTENALFEYAGIGRSFDAHISITGVHESGQVKYRQIAVWIPAQGEVDNSGFDLDGIFQPMFMETQYRIVNGQAIEYQKLGETQKTMREIARLLELRSRALLMVDPTHDIGINYFHAIDCASPTASEIRCTNTIASSPSGFMAVSSPLLDLKAISGIDTVMANDAWGRPIEINNSYFNDPANPDAPPYTARLRSVPPWGAADIIYSPVFPDRSNIYISAVQMIN